MNIPSHFKDLHKQPELLFLPNAWDTLSALILEQAGFQAIGTTSWGVANAMGYSDGQRITFDDLLSVVEKILAAVTIPVTVDVEAGFSNNPTIVAENILKIADLGAAGINIEDSLKTSSGMQEKDKHSELLAGLRQILDSNGYADFFINARIDTYLQQQNPLAQTIERAISYVNSGADGVFVPGLCQRDEIQQLSSNIAAPLNVMSLPSFTEADGLCELGVKRFSIGNAFSDATISFIEESAKILLMTRNTSSLYTDSVIRTAFR